MAIDKKHPSFHSEQGFRKMLKPLAFHLYIREIQT